MQKRCLQCDGVRGVRPVEVYVSRRGTPTLVYCLRVCRECEDILDAMLSQASVEQRLDIVLKVLG